MRRSHLIFLVATILLLTLALHSVSTLLSLLVTDTALQPILPTDLQNATSSSNNSIPQLIPKIIHQTYITTSIPLHWRSAQASCIKMHPDYEYKFWTDLDCLAFITREYPDFLSTFVSYPYNIQRADAIRYFLLAHYGGLYIDLDNGCNRRLDPLLQFPAWVHLTRPTGISNDGMGAAPGHPFYLFVIDQLQRYNRSWILPYVTVMATTGPLFLSLVWKKYARLHATDSVAGQVWVLSPEQYFNSDTAFFDLSAGGSSWHNEDAKYLVWLGKNVPTVIVAGLAMAAVMLIFIRWARRRKQQSRRTRESSSVEPASSGWKP